MASSPSNCPLEEVIVHVDFVEGPDGWRAEPGNRALRPDDWELDYRVMVTALRGYVRKNAFGRVLLGLSGGVDSALVAAIAADALGPENVRCVMLPSEYTSRTSLEDAAAVAAALGCSLVEIPIDAVRAAVSEALAPRFGNRPPGIAERNIQSRLRGLLLMALRTRLAKCC